MHRQVDKTADRAHGFDRVDDIQRVSSLGEIFSALARSGRLVLQNGPSAIARKASVLVESFQIHARGELYRKGHLATFLE